MGSRVQAPSHRVDPSGEYMTMPDHVESEGPVYAGVWGKYQMDVL